MSTLEVVQLAQLQRMLDGRGDDEGLSEAHALRDVLVRTLAQGRALVEELEARRRAVFDPVGDMVDEIGPYAYVSEVLAVALDATLDERDEDSRARGLRDVADALEEALRTELPDVRDAIDIRLVERLLGHPDQWIALRSYAGDALRACVAERLQYFSWDEDAYGPVFEEGEPR